MTTETQSTVFGEDLAELMEARGIPATEERIGELAATSGLDPDRFIARVTGETLAHVGHLEELALALDLSIPDMCKLALAYTFEQRS
jgi:hypothetical protein